MFVVLEDYASSLYDLSTVPVPVPVPVPESVSEEEGRGLTLVWAICGLP